MVCFNVAVVFHGVRYLIPLDRKTSEIQSAQSNVYGIFPNKVLITLEKRESVAYISICLSSHVLLLAELVQQNLTIFHLFVYAYQFKHEKMY